MSEKIVHLNLESEKKIDHKEKKKTWNCTVSSLHNNGPKYARYDHGMILLPS